jgi:hypothetical protein
LAKSQLCKARLTSVNRSSFGSATPAVSRYVRDLMKFIGLVG